MSIEILTRLNPKVSQFDAVGISTAGGLTSADISAACSNCTPLGYLALKRRVIGDTTTCSGYYEVYAKVIKLAIKENWQVKPKSDRIPKFRALLDLCLSDYFEISRCKYCKGSGKKATDKAGILFRTCNACEGSGNKSKNMSTRARDLGVNPSTYSRVWSKRYDKVMDMFDNIFPNEEYYAIRNIKRLLRP